MAQFEWYRELIFQPVSKKFEAGFFMQTKPASAYAG